MTRSKWSRKWNQKKKNEKRKKSAEPKNVENRKEKERGKKEPLKPSKEKQAKYGGMMRHVTQVSFFLSLIKRELQGLRHLEKRDKGENRIV